MALDCYTHWIGRFIDGDESGGRGAVVVVWLRVGKLDKTRTTKRRNAKLQHLQELGVDGR